MVPFVLLVAAVSCGDDDDGDTTVDAAATTDAQILDAQAVAPDAPAAPDAAAPDAAPPDAAPPDAAPAVPDTLFAFLNGSLFRVDLATATLTEVGATGLEANSFSDAEWDGAAGVARVVVNGFTAPHLATMDLCTGTVTTGPRLSLDASDLSIAEAFTVDPTTGTLYAAIDADGGAPNISETMATIDLATGAATVLGPVTTLQNDIDQLVWTDAGLVGLDVLVGTGATLYDVNTMTGATSVRANVLNETQRMVYDTAGARLLAVTRENPRRLIELDLDTGELTEVGATHTSAEHGGFAIDALLVAPAPACP